MERKMIRVSASLALAFLAVLPPVGELPEFPGESHCVLVVIGQTESGELITAPPVCLEDEGLARLWAGPALAVAGAPGLEAASISALATFNLGVHYDGFNGTGSSIAIVGSTCTGGYWNTPTAWDNRISSSLHGCAALRHYDLPAKGGAFQLTTGVGTIKNLGTLNNRAESVSYSAS
jgi:hypothetical protein